MLNLIKYTKDFLPEIGDRIHCDIAGVHHIAEIIDIGASVSGTNTLITYKTLESLPSNDIVNKIHTKALHILLTYYSKIISYPNYNKVWNEINA